MYIDFLLNNKHNLIQMFKEDTNKIDDVSSTLEYYINELEANTKQ